jgi:hypothetical protein
VWSKVKRQRQHSAGDVRGGRAACGVRRAACGVLRAAFGRQNSGDSVLSRPPFPRIKPLPPHLGKGDLNPFPSFPALSPSYPPFPLPPRPRALAGHVSDFSVTWAPDQQFEELLAAADDGAAAAAAEAGADARVEEVPPRRLLSLRCPSPPPPSLCVCVINERVEEVPSPPLTRALRVLQFFLVVSISLHLSVSVRLCCLSVHGAVSTVSC